MKARTHVHTHVRTWREVTVQYSRVDGKHQHRYGECVCLSTTATDDTGECTCAIPTYITRVICAVDSDFNVTLPVPSPRGAKPTLFTSSAFVELNWLSFAQFCKCDGPVVPYCQIKNKYSTSTFQ